MRGGGAELEGGARLCVWGAECMEGVKPKLRGGMALRQAKCQIPRGGGGSWFVFAAGSLCILKLHFGIAHVTTGKTTVAVW